MESQEITSLANESICCPPSLHRQTDRQTEGTLRANTTYAYSHQDTPWRAMCARRPAGWLADPTTLHTPLVCQWAEVSSASLLPAAASPPEQSLLGVGLHLTFCVSSQSSRICSRRCPSLTVTQQSMFLVHTDMIVSWSTRNGSCASWTRLKSGMATYLRKPVWLAGMSELLRSHRGLCGRPKSISASPCSQNSCCTRSVHFRWMDHSLAACPMSAALISSFSNIFLSSPCRGVKSGVLSRTLNALISPKWVEGSVLRIRDITMPRK
mmetsp:Transcript_322/g.977  ORF Transcript_322/g.977 Transcript_322/m.977 type:complete len:267 (+) Transcript_322:359-1159(+)